MKRRASRCPLLCDAGASVAAETLNLWDSRYIEPVGGSPKRAKLPVSGVLHKVQRGLDVVQRVVRHGRATLNRLQAPSRLGNSEAEVRILKTCVPVPAMGE